jgi:aldehyde dehydrogenase (NAD+)
MLEPLMIVGAIGLFPFPPPLWLQHLAKGKQELTYAAYIDGAFREGEGAEFSVENPSDENIVETLAGVSARQVEAAIASARTAFDDGRWSKLSAKDRAAILFRFGEAMQARAERFTRLAIDEAGCPISSSVMRAQVATPLAQIPEIIEYFLSLPEQEENPVAMHERVGPWGAVQSLKRYTPIGVASAIAAYNVPLFTALWKVVPGLIAGNSLILRPNPLTPLSAMLFAEAADEAGLPAGVLNVIIEGGLEGGLAITTDPRIDMVSFTGSCAVGAKVAEQAAPTLKRLVLELGGKSAQIFLPDAVDKAAMQAMVIAVAHAGQGCALGTRLFVPEESKAKVLEAAAELFAKIKVGPAGDPTTQTGPVISAAQRARCEFFTAAAVENGGRVVAGGKRPAHLEKGYYFEPTLLDLPDNKNPAAQEEIFGPVAAVIGYRDLDHAVEMANDSRYGLAGYVHGSDKAMAMKVGLAINSGTVNVNGGMMSVRASMGGIKMSGLGRERGLEGLRAYQNLTVFNMGG